MKKYTPSVKNNNELKDEVLSMMKSLIFRCEKGKFNVDLDKDLIAIIVSSLKIATEDFENTIGLGEENVLAVYENAKKNIEDMKQTLDDRFVGRVEFASDNLEYALSMWTSLLNGENQNIEDEFQIEQQKVNRTRRKLNARLDELGVVKSDFVLNEKRLDREIENIEKDLKELDRAMLSENNQRKINDLYRQITATKSKLNVYEIRKASYSSCFNTLDIILSLANEIVVASDFSVDEIGKAKALLNVARLKSVITEPDKAVSILKRMQDDLKQISQKTKMIDDKIFGLGTEQIVVNDDAMRYKEELMKREREKNNFEVEAEELQKVAVENEKKNVEI